MVYPVFSVESIAERCKKDIDDFLKQEGMTDYKPRFELIVTPFASKADLEVAIKPVKEFIETNLPSTYVQSISKVEDLSLQRELWIARTYLFYQLMIFVVAILGNSQLYTDVFGEPDNKTVFPFREIVTANYQMGIFGSKTPTSDIDVGVQYIGTSQTEAPGLAYMISAFENVFLRFTGKSSLDFDIESYADMYLYKGDDGADYFYLDMGNFTIDDFKRILPVAGQSIARNVFIDHGPIAKTFQQVNNTVREALKGSTTNYGDCLATIEDPEIVKALNNPDWFRDSMNKMEAFLKMSYDEQRALYYATVQKGETLKFEKAPTFSEAQNLDNKTVCDLIIAFGDALSYRMESYTASPTITHVVRILQADKVAAEKYATKSPIELCNGVPRGTDPYCAIGKYGFIISILEQIGYMYRFYHHYCVEENYREKCEKKIKKYGDRYKNAFSSFLGFKTKVSEARKKSLVNLKHTIKKVGGRKNKTRRTRKTKSRKNRKNKSYR
jgi:hypothetical protein